jgi:hypothetical protein
MAVVKLSTAGLTNYAKYSSMLAGNAPFSASAYDLLETTTLSSSASGVTFSGLDTLAAGYAHLQIRAVVRGVQSGTATLKANLNGDTGSNYSYHRLEGNGSSVSSAGGGSIPFLSLGKVPGTSDSSEVFAPAIIDILNFSSTSQNTTARALSGNVGDVNNIALKSGLWVNTAAVTSISFANSSGDMVAGTRFSLYGIKAA